MLISQGLIDLTKEVSLGDRVDDFVLVLLEVAESFCVVALLDEVAYCEENDFAHFVGPHSTLRSLLFLELEHALDR